MNIEKIYIKNYRGIKEIELDNFKKYNIFVGDNSSCKTTIMEALYISLPKVYNGLIKTANSRGMQVRLDNIHDFFYNGNIKNEIEFILNNEISTKIIKNNVYIENLNFENTKYQVKEVNIQYQNKKKLYNIIKKYKNYIENLNVMIDEFSQVTLENEENINIEYRNIEENIWITPLTKYQHGIAEIIKKVIENKNKKELLEVINILEFEIEDIISDGFEIKLDKKDTKKLLSLHSFGNGLISILNIVANIINNEVNVIFIDEIEDGIHYLNYNNFCRLLIKILEKRDIQLFITTHSKEFLETFYTLLNTKEDDLALYRFQREVGKIKKKYISKEQVINILEEGWDVR